MKDTIMDASLLPDVQEIYGVLTVLSSGYGKAGEFETQRDRRDLWEQLSYQIIHDMELAHEIWTLYCAEISYGIPVTGSKDYLRRLKKIEKRVIWVNSCIHRWSAGFRLPSIFMRCEWYFYRHLLLVKDLFPLDHDIWERLIGNTAARANTLYSLKKNFEFHHRFSNFLEASQNQGA